MSEQGEYVQRSIRELGEERDRLRVDVEDLSRRLVAVAAWRDSLTREYAADLARVTAERDNFATLASDLLMALHEAEMTTPDGPGHMSHIVTLQLARDALREAVEAHSIARARATIAQAGVGASR
jgi:hypothetical protein